MMQPVLTFPRKEKGNTHAWYLRITTLAMMMGTVVWATKITTTVTTIVTWTWLTAGPPTVVQASSRAKKGKRRNRCRSRSIRVREE